MPDAIDNKFLRVVGISDIVFGRVTEALRFLGLIQEDGRPTDTLRAIAKATEDDYRNLLAGVVREAYRDDFQLVDPSRDSQSKIVDAFRQYQPRSQSARMVMLFLGLCREAGIPVLDAPRERQMQTPNERRPKGGRASVRRAPRNRESSNSPNGSSSPSNPPAPVIGGALFGVTEDDIAALTEDEFQEVWSALGKVARARARSKSKGKAGTEPGPDTNPDDDQED